MNNKYYLGGHNFKTTNPSQLTVEQQLDLAQAGAQVRESSKMSAMEDAIRNRSTGAQLLNAKNRVQNGDPAIFNIKIPTMDRDTAYRLAVKLGSTVHTDARDLSKMRGDYYMATQQSDIDAMSSKYSSTVGGLSTMGGVEMGGRFYLGMGKGSTRDMNKITYLIEQELEAQFINRVAVLDKETLGGVKLSVSQDLNVPLKISLNRATMQRIGLGSLVGNGCGCTGGVDGTAGSRKVLQFHKGDRHANTEGDNQLSSSRAFFTYLDKVEIDPVKIGNMVLTMTKAISRDGYSNVTKDFSYGMPFDLLEGDMIVAGTIDILNECNIQTICETLPKSMPRMSCANVTNAAFCVWSEDCFTDAMMGDYAIGEDGVAADTVRNNLASVYNSLATIQNNMIYDGEFRTDAGTPYNMTPGTNQMSMTANYIVPNGNDSVVNAIHKLSPRQNSFAIDISQLASPRGKRSCIEGLALMSAQCRTGMVTVDGNRDLVVAGAVGKARILGDFLEDTTEYSIKHTSPTDMAMAQKLYQAQLNKGTNPKNSIITAGLVRGNITDDMLVDDAWLDSSYKNIDALYVFEPKSVKKLVKNYDSLIAKMSPMMQKFYSKEISINGGNSVFDAHGFNSDPRESNLIIFSNVKQVEGYRMDMSNMSVMPTFGVKSNALKLYGRMDTGIALTGEGVMNTGILKLSAINRNENAFGQPTFYKARLEEADGDFGDRVRNFVLTRKANIKF